jgi:hypothetical protein
MMVDAIHSGRFCDSSRSEIKEALQSMIVRLGTILLETCIVVLPTRSAVGRLALSVGVPVGVVSSRGGYRDVSRFMRSWTVGWLCPA